jgi:beta-lactamase superfamily II metal-dependent hydrolase
MKKRWIILGGVCFSIILFEIGILQLNGDCLQVTFFDVGQGDAIFIETPENRQILIDGGRTSLKILYPFESLENQAVKSTNNSSIVARLVFGDHSFLFTGDAYQTIEKELLKRGAVLDSDFLKIAHHGSKYSSSPEFIGEVSPEAAVISAGKDNKYGHPNQDTLDRLAGIKVLRTDQSGDIVIRMK